MVVNCPCLTRLVGTVLRPYIAVLYTIRNDEKWLENRVFDRLRYDEKRPVTTGLVSPGGLSFSIILT